MILVDTSLWIELLNGTWGRAVTDDDLLGIVTCGPILQEITRGLRDCAAGDAIKDLLLAVPRISDPLPVDLYLEGAEIYRQGRRRGLTIRSSTDCLIAAVAIRNRMPVWHRDRDFELIAQYTGLRTGQPWT